MNDTERQLINKVVAVMNLAAAYLDRISDAAVYDSVTHHRNNLMIAAGALARLTQIAETKGEKNNG